MRKLKWLVLIPILFGIILGISAQDFVEPVVHVCGNTYQFAAEDYERYTFVPQDGLEMTNPASSEMTIESEGGLIVWVDLSYYYIPPTNGACAEEQTAEQNYWQNAMLIAVRNMKMDLSEVFGD